MRLPSQRLILIAVFTVLLIVLVNLVWWLFYQKTERMLDEQLARRLSSLAQASTITLSNSLILSLRDGDLDSYAATVGLLEELRLTDSLSEVFILDETYRYLATTSLEADSTYFLTLINGIYLDSLFFGLTENVIVSPTYQTGSLYLKSVFAPIRDSLGVTYAVLGVEASVDYFEDLYTLKTGLSFSTAMSLLAGLGLGLIFLLLQRQLNRTERRLFLSETHAYLGRMVAVVAHEIKTPLMIIRGSAERIKKKTDMNEAGDIIEEADRLNGVVSGYLSFAKADGALLSGDHAERFDCIPFISDVKKQIVAKYAPEVIIWLEYELPDTFPVTSYRGSLRQVLVNLLFNGADACKNATKPITLGLFFEQQARTFSIHVIDTGTGISKQEQRKLFEPFYTTKQTGSGLGLYLSKKLIVEMGGNLHIESKKNEGTAMVVTLPVDMKDAHGQNINR
ncbi:MAG: ATP-binding protein [candidate division Zixibacteria bacterium]|nr:ATP-binding protein [candidate division Zixibacteria bacterium]